MAPNNVEIIEQPAERLFRFRYESEGRNGGSILGVSSTRDISTFPKIRVNNYIGPIAVYISCVTNETKPRQHPHKLSKAGIVSDSGIYVRKFNVCASTKEFEFNDIGIVFVKKENIPTALRKREEKNNDPTRGGWSHTDKPQLIDLHCVRLCFQVLGKVNSSEFNTSIGCAVTTKILDKKSHGSLNIVELSATISQAQGGDKILLFCDRVKREDIAIIFYEEKQTADGPKRTWEHKLNEKNCKSMAIHHQYGIKFIMPSYKNPDITEPHPAYIQLHRPSDNEYSKPIPFEFIPNDQMTKSIHLVNKKRKMKKMNAAVAPFLAQMTNENDDKKKNLILKPTTKYGRNGNNRQNDTVQRKVQQPVIEGQLIDFADDDGKENVCESYQMPNEMRVNLNQAENWRYQMQYGHHPPDNMAQYAYARTAATHYQSSMQPANVNDRFDHLTNAQPSHNMHTPLVPTNAYHHPHYQQQHDHYYPPQQHQSHSVNTNANGYAAGAQNIHPAMNHMPFAYNNNYNMPPNQPNHATTNYNYNTADANIDSNPLNLNVSEILANTRTSELFDPARDVVNLEMLSKEYGNLGMD